MMRVSFENGIVTETGYFDQVELIDARQQSHARVIAFDMFAERYFRGPKDVLVLPRITGEQSIREGSCYFSYYCRDLSGVFGVQVFGLFTNGNQTPMANELVIRYGRWDRPSDVMNRDISYPNCASKTEYIRGECANMIMKLCIQVGDGLNDRITYTESDPAVIGATISAIDSFGNHHSLTYYGKSKPCIYDSLVSKILEIMRSIPDDSKNSHFELTLFYM